MNKKWIRWSMTFASAAVFGVVLTAGGCGSGSTPSVEEPDKPKEFKKSTVDKSNKEAFMKGGQGGPALEPKLLEQLKEDLE